MPRQLKIGTWNVNGIRARLDQVQDWMQREQPDVVCLQEIKASPDQIPMFLCELEGYWCYWHGAQGLFRRRAPRQQGALARASRLRPSRLRLRAPHRRRRISPARPIASVYVPNGGKDFPAKMRFLTALEQFAADSSRRGGGQLVICGDLNVARTDIDV